MLGAMLMMACGAVLVRLANAAVSDSNVGSPSVAGYTLKANGEIIHTDGSGGSTAGQWITPAALAGGNYECRVTVNSGALTTGTANSWLALSSDRSWTCQQFTTGAAEAVIAVEIRRADTAQVVASATVTLSAVVF